MSLSRSLYDHAAIIAPSSRQDDFLALREANPLLDFHLYTREQVEQMFGYQFDDRALICLIKEGKSYSLAKEMLNAMRLAQKTSFLTSKMQELLARRDKFISEGLCYQLPYPERSFENHSVVISGYPDVFRVTKILGELHNMAISFDKEPLPRPLPPTVSAFSDIYEEVHYVYNRIAEDLKNGTSIDDIYILGADESYDPLFDEFSKKYGFRVETKHRCRLCDTSAFRQFLINFDSSHDLNKSLDALKQKGFLEESDQFADLFLPFLDGFSFQEARSLFVEIAAYYPKKEPHYQHVVRRLDSFLPSHDAHVYLMNFSMGVFPRIEKETGFFSDEDLASAELMVSREKTREEAEELSVLLSSSSLQAITFKHHAFGNTFFLSGLVKRNHYRVEDSPVLPFEYAADKGAFLLASLLDQKEDYLYEDSRLASLSKATSLPSFRTYDYRYSPFVPLLPSKRHYSPTTLESFFGCPFSYYLDRIAKLHENENSFLARVGVIFHAVMASLYGDKSFSFETSWTKALDEERQKNGPFTGKEEALLMGLEKRCHEAVSFYQKHDTDLKEKRVTTEKPFEIPSASNEVSFSGQYDKIVEFGPSFSYFLIIDYKTGSTRFHEELLPYGLSLQLPFYAFFAFHDPSFKDKKLAGLFIGPILSSAAIRPENKTQEEFLADSFKLDGVFSQDPDIVRSFDPSLSQSDLLRGCAYGQKGWRHYSSSFNRDKSAKDFQALADKASEKALEADERIRKGDFSISPIRYKNIFDACQNCPYRDICYRPDSAVKEIYFDGSKKDEENNDGLDE